MHVPILVLLLFVYFFLSPRLGFLMFLLGFISSLPQLVWEKGFDVVVLTHAKVILALFLYYQICNYYLIPGNINTMISRKHTIIQ
jgi:hypothetical protein